jgi:hypothetical protein
MQNIGPNPEEQDICFLQTASAIELNRQAEISDSPNILQASRDESAPPAYELKHLQPDDAFAMKSLGVSLNGVGDLNSFLSGVASIAGMCFAISIAFTILRRYFPMVYYHNSQIGIAPKKLAENDWNFIRVALSTTTQEVAEHLTLDSAMLLEFTNLSMKILFLLAVPMTLIMGVIHFVFGGNAAGEDHMSYLSIGNVKSCSTGSDGKRLFPGFSHCWIYDVHALVVWVVVLTVDVFVYRAQSAFMERRARWMQNMPEPRCSTVLVENIPKEYRSDAKLKEYFVEMFGEEKVKSAYVVKRIRGLSANVKALNALELKLKEYEALSEKTGERPQTLGYDGQRYDALKYYQDQVEAKRVEVEQGRAAAKEEALTAGSPVNGSNGFITFAARGEVEIVLGLQLSADVDEFVCSVPPDAESVRFEDLDHDEYSTTLRTGMGYALVAVLYCAYLPIVFKLTTIAKSINMGKLNSIWQSMAPTIGLLFVVSFLPTLLLLVFRLCFTLKAEIWEQLALQKWYFVFQVVFIILVTAVGTDAVAFTRALMQSPFSLFAVLGDSMPQASHYYWNFLVAAWSGHFLNLTRNAQLWKYLGYRALFTGLDDSEEMARKMAEPEDQDYYGMGSRSARFTIMFCIGIIFGTLAPPVLFLAGVNFFICRVVYGYLMPYAEGKKADSGGAFWCSQLQHVFVGNLIYCVLMTGVLMRRAETWRPVAIAALSLVYVGCSMRRFKNKFAWERLPYKTLHDIDTGKFRVTRPKAGLPYQQPELFPPEST